MLFEIHEVSFVFPDGTSALDSISLCVAEGERVAILGANGSGKSTLLRVLDALLWPSAGRVKFRGQALDEHAMTKAEFRATFRAAVGFVFQNAEAQLFNATVEEEIAFGPNQLGLPESETAGRVRDVAGFLGISQLLDRPPFRLSGGEQRKVAIASVLSMNPDVLLFDEPFLGLDPRSHGHFIRTIQQLQAAGKTTVVATHSVDAVPRIADRVIVLGEDHRILLDAPVQAALADTELLAAANLIESA